MTASETYEVYRRAREAREQAEKTVARAQEVLNKAYADETQAEVAWEVLRRQELENAKGSEGQPSPGP